MDWLDIEKVFNILVFDLICYFITKLFINVNLDRVLFVNKYQNLISF